MVWLPIKPLRLPVPAPHAYFPGSPLRISSCPRNAPPKRSLLVLCLIIFDTLTGIRLSFRLTCDFIIYVASGSKLSAKSDLTLLLRDP